MDDLPGPESAHRSTAGAPPTGGAPSPGPEPTARAVFEILVREQAGMVMAYLRSLLPSRAAAIDDLFQETMLVAWRRLSDYDRSRPLGPWLRGIAANLVLEYRRKSVRGVGGAGSAVVTAYEPEVLEGLERRHEAWSQVPADSFRQRLAQLRECIGRLPERLREAVELVYARGLLVRQAAESLGVDEEAVKKRVQRARRSLGECLRANGMGGAS